MRVNPSLLTKDKIDRIGNAIIYFAERIPNLNTTQVLKLLYLTEEQSVKVFHKPLFGVDFEVWKRGPVVREVFIELSDTPMMLSEYIRIQDIDEATIVYSIKEFSDDEFSDHDIELLDRIIRDFGAYNDSDLARYTCHKGSLWHKTATRYGLLEGFDAGTATSSDVVIDLSEHLTGCEKEFYDDYMESSLFFDQFTA